MYMDFNKLLQMLQWQKNQNGIGENMGPLYREPGLTSVGGSLKLPFGGPQVGGTIGMDNGQLFGNTNINSNPIAAFGTGDSGLVDNGGRPQNQGQINPFMQILQQLMGKR